MATKNPEETPAFKIGPSYIYIELVLLNYILPTLSLGIILSSEPCFRKTFPVKRKKKFLVYVHIITIIIIIIIIIITAT